MMIRRCRGGRRGKVFMVIILREKVKFIDDGSIFMIRK
jgi:hypothetical protein